MTCPKCNEHILKFNESKKIDHHSFIKLVNEDESHLSHVIESINDKESFFEYLIGETTSWICIFPSQYVTNVMFIKFLTSRSVGLPNFRAWNSYRYYTAEPSIDKSAAYWIKVKHKVDMAAMEAFGVYLKEREENPEHIACKTFSDWHSEYTRKQAFEK